MKTTDGLAMSHAQCAMVAADMSYEIESLRQLRLQQMRETLEFCKPLVAYGVVGSRDVDQAKFQKAIDAALALPPVTLEDLK